VGLVNAGLLSPKTRGTEHQDFSPFIVVSLPEREPLLRRPLPIGTNDTRAASTRPAPNDPLGRFSALRSSPRRCGFFWLDRPCLWLDRGGGRSTASPGSFDEAIQNPLAHDGFVPLHFRVVSLLLGRHTPYLTPAMIAADPPRSAATLDGARHVFSSRSNSSNRRVALVAAGRFCGGASGLSRLLFARREDVHALLALSSRSTSACLLWWRRTEDPARVALLGCEPASPPSASTAAGPDGACCCSKPIFLPRRTAARESA